MGDSLIDDELGRLAQRLTDLQRENQRIDLELEALQAEGEARQAERAAAPENGRELFEGLDGDGASPDHTGPNQNGTAAN